MGKHKESQVSSFSLEGRFSGFISELGKPPKRIRVVTSQGEHLIKLSKELRVKLYEVLQPGDLVQIFGEQKYTDKTRELKLKAFQVKLTASQKPETISPPPVAASKPKSCIMVCQKSACRQRGANQVCQAISESLRDRGLDDQVAIKGTGCMKQCKKGPCVVFMPDKSRYTGVAPSAVSMLIEKHFAAKLKPQVSQPEFSPAN